MNRFVVVAFPKVNLFLNLFFVVEKGKKRGPANDGGYRKCNFWEWGIHCGVVTPHDSFYEVRRRRHTGSTHKRFLSIQSRRIKDCIGAIASEYPWIVASGSKKGEAEFFCRSLGNPTNPIRSLLIGRMGLLRLILHLNHGVQVWIIFVFDVDVFFVRSNSSLFLARFSSVSLRPKRASTSYKPEEPGDQGLSLFFYFFFFLCVVNELGFKQRRSRD